MRTPAGANSLHTDFDLMRSVANATDSRNDEIRSMLHAFIGEMSSVPPAVWGGSPPPVSRMWWIAGTQSRCGSIRSCTRSPKPFGTTRPCCGRPATTTPTTSPQPAETFD